MIDREKLNTYLVTLPAFAIITPDQYTDGRQCYMAEHTLLSGCMSHGDTPEEALDNLKEACELYLENVSEEAAIPQPSFTVSHATGATHYGAKWEAVTEEEFSPKQGLFVLPGISLTKGIA